ncbi:serine hydrolase [Geothrix sp. PMB-07]|uniref:serine hydrolase domain-containing protein n=1 Tax=Geothrix sp. PMB-07 TaxID=3068640 RepID=UPI00274150D2|nr:serine hydrolase [Geothrix sp. PMB-07]WLT32001.1 serine hydrolase [Geothrix sp. PMB-07]
MTQPARRGVRRFLRLALACVGLWLLWVCLLRPISPRVGPAPAAVADGWSLGSLQQAGLNPAQLTQVANRLFEKRLNVHSLLIERHGCLAAEYYQGGTDKSVYSLLPSRHRFGPRDKQDVRSIGKSITSLLYGLAREQGKVPAVETTVWAAFPEHGNRRTAANQAIRIEDLLNMTSGLQWQEGKPGPNDELRLFWKSDLVDFVLSHPQAAVPNTCFNYNGGGTALLAELIRRGTGQSLEQYADEMLFRPLQIEDWAWVPDVHGRAMAFNGLRLRPRDLLKVGRLMLNHGAWQGRQLVPQAWIAQSMTPRFDTDVRDYRYAYQWWHGTATWHGQRIDWHAGFGNGGQRLYVVPALDLSVVTTAGAYDELPTAIRVNDLIQEVVDAVEN